VIKNETFLDKKTKIVLNKNIFTYQYFCCDFWVPSNITGKGAMTNSLEEDFVDSNGITSASSGNIAFQGYNETSANKGVLEYRTYYNLVTNNGSMPSKIKKEIIILDGYDPGDGRKIYDKSVGYDSEKKSLYELMAYDHDNNPATDKINLVEKLRNAPYGLSLIHI
jgi:hypothetical protein